MKTDEWDGGIACLNVLYKFTTGMEFDQIFYAPKVLNYKEFHKVKQNNIIF